MREYVDPTIGVATLDETLTVMVGSGDDKIMRISTKTQSYHSLCTVISMVVKAVSIALGSVALHVYVPA